MLHALLHGKLDEAIPEPQRLEDALTSTIVGTLVMVGAWDVLRRWFKLAPAHDTADDRRDCECWFWPRLFSAEPDAVLRIGTTLVAVEAKLHSNRNDLAPAVNPLDTDRISDQLLRQWQSLATPVNGRRRYDEALETAISACQSTTLVQIFLVDARRLSKARAEWRDSKGKLPANADLRLVTWQSLYRLLELPLSGGNRWASDLQGYLDLCGTAPFRGVPRDGVNLATVSQLPRWKPARSSASFRSAAVASRMASVSSLLGWRASESPRRFSTRLSLCTGLIDKTTRATLLAWTVGFPIQDQRGKTS